MPRTLLALLQHFLGYIRSTKPSSPLPEDVEIVPCTGIDVQTKHIVVTNGLLVGSRLDCEKLKSSLVEVVKAKFPKAGARLVCQDSTYHFHIPQSFSEAIPPVAFTTENYDEVYAHSTRPRIPKPSTTFAGPFTQPFPAFERFLRSNSCPGTLDGFLVPNTPLVHVHITTFDDVTFIGITSSHMMFDALGTKTLLEAWCRRLNGTKLEEIAGMEWNSAPFESFHNLPTTGRRGWYDLTFLGKLQFVCSILWRKLFDRRDVALLVCVPKVFLCDLKTDVMGELTARNLGEWVGSSDVLLAWWYKTVYGHRTDSTPISIHVPFDLRRIFSKTILSAPYLHNAVMTLPIPPLPAHAFGTLSLADIALHFRSAISAYMADVDGIQSDVSFRLGNPTKVLFPCPAHGEFVILTNWRSAKFGELDFSGAASGSSPTRILFMVGYPKYSRGVPMRGSGIVMHEDDDAIWLYQVRGGRDWERLKLTSQSNLLFT